MTVWDFRCSLKTSSGHCVCCWSVLLVLMLCMTAPKDLPARRRNCRFGQLSEQLLQFVC